MGNFDITGPSAYDSDPDDVLEEYDPYIKALARKKVPHTVIHPALLRDEIDELAQEIRIKLWLALRRQQIATPKAYIRSIAHTQSVDVVRQRRRVSPLPESEDGEIYQGNLLVTSGEGMQDPAEEFEHAEKLVEEITEAVDHILILPPCQQFAIICSLKEQLADVLLAVDLLKGRGIDFGSIQWPESKEEIQSLRSSLSIARKKLRSWRRR